MTLNDKQLRVKFEMDLYIPSQNPTECKGMYNVPSQNPTERKGLCLFIHNIKGSATKKQNELQQKQQFHTFM